MDFSQNKIKSLPSEIYSLHNLTFLNVSSNELSSLPDAPHSQLLPALTAINLGYNLFQNFPVPLLYMSAVTEIDIPNNSLLDIPPAIHYLVQLRRINARDNKITGTSFETNYRGVSGDHVDLNQWFSTFHGPWPPALYV